MYETTQVPVGKAKTIIIIIYRQFRQVIVQISTYTSLKRQNTFSLLETMVSDPSETSRQKLFHS